MRTILIGIALGVGCANSVQGLVFADKQRCDALTLWVRLFHGAVTFRIARCDGLRCHVAPAG
jgi:hypothetical protein